MNNNTWNNSPLPGLTERPEDIEPNLDYELKRYEEATGMRVTFNKEARELFLTFAVSPGALWSSNFRDLNGAVTRMCTLAPGGRITMEGCREEIERLRCNWQVHCEPGVSKQPEEDVDADRLKKYLSRYNITWEDIHK